MTTFCPFDLERRPCAQHACTLYVQMRWQDPQGNTCDDWSCVFVAQLRLQANACYELVRGQASNDKVATAVHNGFGSLLALAAAGPRAIDANPG